LQEKGTRSDFSRLVVFPSPPGPLSLHRWEKKKKNKQSSSAVLPAWVLGKQGDPTSLERENEEKKISGGKKKTKYLVVVVDDERAEVLRTVSGSVLGTSTEEEVDEQLGMACAPGRRFPAPSNALETP
jgi:hypothetical protein